MTRSKIAAFLALAFVVLFCFSGVTATTTVKDVTVSLEMGLPKLLFSLSSAPLLLIPLVRPLLSTALAWTLAIALSIMNLAAIPLRADCIRRS